MTSVPEPLAGGNGGLARFADEGISPSPSKPFLSEKTATILMIGAAAILLVGGIVSVFMGRNFIPVNLSEKAKIATIVAGSAGLVGSLALTVANLYIYYPQSNKKEKAREDVQPSAQEKVQEKRNEIETIDWKSRAHQLNDTVYKGKFSLTSDLSYMMEIQVQKRDRSGGTLIIKGLKNNRAIVVNYDVVEQSFRDEETKKVEVRNYFAFSSTQHEDSHQRQLYSSIGFFMSEVIEKLKNPQNAKVTTL